MIRFTTLRKTALSLPEVTEEPHFEKTSFRVSKKIFVSYDESQHRACIKLSEFDQGLFSAYDNTIIFPVPNKWGKQGWTFIDMKHVPKEMFTDALKTAYCEVAPKKLSVLIKKNT
jgi:predicted DNA-binding protein (MmcQ/YjbR family)